MTHAYSLDPGARPLADLSHRDRGHTRRGRRRPGGRDSEMAVRPGRRMDRDRILLHDLDAGERWQNDALRDRKYCCAAENGQGLVVLIENCQRSVEVGAALASFSTRSSADFARLCTWWTPGGELRATPSTLPVCKTLPFDDEASPGHCQSNFALLKLVLSCVHRGWLKLSKGAGPHVFPPVKRLRETGHFDVAEPVGDFGDR